MDHKELDVWKEAIEFVVGIYALTKSFPDSEVYGLTNQLRRAAVSVTSNIAEGAARGSDKEFVRFLHIALGSIAEAETQIIIAEKLGFTSESKEILGCVQGIRKKLVGLIRYLKNKS